MFKEFLDNQMRDFNPMSLEKLPKERMMQGRGKPALYFNTGAEVQENGDVIFRIRAPEANKVEIRIGRNVIELRKGEDGIFTGTHEFDPSCCGFRPFDVVVDGLTVIYPYAPVCMHMWRQRNCVEIPDPGTEYRLLNRVPHGAVTTDMYYSKTLGRYMRCLVYTPPGYMKGTDSYPVLYLQHGASENETVWVYDGKVGLIMDNLIAEGKAKPFVIVMNNGEVRYPDNTDGMRSMDDAFEKMLINDCIPFIEENYRVLTGKENRAMAGLSMGSMQTSKIGLSHPELFSALGIFSGFMRFGANHNTQTDEHLAIIFDNERFLREYRLFFRSVGEDDNNMMDSFVADEDYVTRSGIDKLPNYVVKKYPLQQHEWGAWYRAFNDFARLVF